ncbi:ADAM family mig-17 [Toxocara canis]|uniref:ADAM family mig-17 n=1 Tax=Toxocara canis TaxID=6265 RepID=A0A0B2V927_TOXCA|nr:ADAM family mig-17 [Toxocara canis]
MAAYVQLFGYLVILQRLFQGECAIQFRRKLTIGGVTFKKAISSNNNWTISTSEKAPLYDGYEVDILMVADFSLYSGFIEILNGDEYSAQFAVNNYLNAIFEQVRAVYENNTVFENEIISLNLVATFVVIREQDCPLMRTNKSENDTYSDNSTSMDLSMNALDAVHVVHEWISKYSEWLPPHDHAIVITKFDLLSPKGDSSTQGMAYVGAMCRGSQSASVVEDIGAMATAMIAAHELAHSLGAFHDGSGESSHCDSTLNYIMAPMVSGSDDNEKFRNSFKLSKCSLKQIETFLVNDTSLCMRRHRGREKRLRRTSNSAGRRKPGEIFLQQHQCKIAFGPDYGVCKHREYLRKKDPCRRLWCKNRNTKRFASCETKNYLPLLDGTMCGPHKASWCIAGNCVDSNKEDNNCVDVNASLCTSLSAVKRTRYCKSVKFSAICCFTCSTRRSTKKSLRR